MRKASGNIRFDGIGFNAKHIESFATLGGWLEHCEDNGHWFAGDTARARKLSEVYSIVHKEQTSFTSQEIIDSFTDKPELKQDTDTVKDEPI